MTAQMPSVIPGCAPKGSKPATDGASGWAQRDSRLEVPPEAAVSQSG